MVKRIATANEKIKEQAAQATQLEKSNSALIHKVKDLESTHEVSCKRIKVLEESNVKLEQENHELDTKLNEANAEVWELRKQLDVLQRGDTVTKAAIAKILEGVDMLKKK